MSSVGLAAGLELDIAAALREVDSLEQRLTAATNVTLRADASAITSAVSAAIEASDSDVVVTGQAENVTGAIDAAVDAADDQVTVTGQADGITGAIDSAVDAADDDVTVTGEADGVTGAIDAAVDAADDTVQVTAEASAVTGAVDAAVDAADTEVQVTADSSSLREASGAADNLNTALIASTRSGLSLRSALQLGGAGSAAAGLFQLTQAASELEQAVGGTTAVFGPAEAGVARFARTAAESAGLTETSARTLTSQIGGLLQGFDFTQQESAALSVTLAQLGADLAATFGGTSQEAVQALGAAIRGETDPIERFGISLNATQADLKAVELGLAASTSEVDANARAQGVLALIMERSANAQGQFAREAETTAGQLERAKAEAGNAAAAIGATLQPALNELISTGRGELIPTLQDLGEELGPGLVSLLTALVPALGGATDLLIAAAPAVSALAAAIDAIPDPALQALAVFLALRAAAGPLGSALGLVTGFLARMAVPAGTVAGAFNGATTSAGTFRGALSGLSGAAVAGNLAMVGLAVATIGIVGAQQRAKQAAAEYEAQQKSLEDALAGSGDAVGSLDDAFETFTQGGLKIAAGNFGNLEIEADDLNSGLADLGISTRDLADAAAEGDAGIDALLRRLEATGDVTEGTANLIRFMADEVNQAARATIEAGLAQGDYTRLQAEGALRATENADGTRNYAGALDQLQAITARNVEQQNNLATAIGGVDADGQTHQVTALGLALAGLQEGVGGSERGFITFALAADAAGLSGAELDAVAAELGTTADRLGPAIDEVAGPIRELADAAQSTLPSISDLAGNFEDFSVQGFRDELGQAYEAVVNFQDNLQALADRPRLAAAAATLGPDFAAELADAARNGREGVLNEIELLLAGLQQEGVDLNNLITGEIGPNLAAGTGQVGEQMTNAFGENFNLSGAVPPSIASVEGNLADAQDGIRTSAENAGRAGAEGFGTGFNIGDGVLPSVRSAEGAIEAERPNMREAGRGLGSEGAAGVSEGFVPDVVAPIQNASGQVAAETPNFVAQVLGLGSSGTVAFDSGFTPETTVTPSIRSIEGTVEAEKPTIIESLLGLGTSATTGFSSGFQPANSIPTRTAQARQAVNNERPGIVETLLGLGTAGTGGFGSGLSGMPGEASTKSDAARARIAAGGGLFERAALATGTSASIGLAQGMQQMSTNARGAVTQAVGAARAAGGGASAAGYSIGAALASGLTAGIKANAGAAAEQAAAMVKNAAAAARAQARIGSPSRLFAEMGEQMVDGLAIGLGESARAELAARSTAKAVAAAFETSATPVVALTGDAAGGGGAVVIQGVPGMVQISLTGDAPAAVAAETGRRAATAFVDTLAASDVRVAARMASA